MGKDYVKQKNNFIEEGVRYCNDIRDPYVSKKWVTYVAYLYLRIAKIHKDRIDSMIW